jgi:1,5-anhydro-D-fructose reductase (1,5-anhydro-D-mannitol-forming)
VIRIGIVGCGRILAAHLRGYRLLRAAGYDGFRISALCARRSGDALGYVQRGGDHPQRRAVSDIPGDPLGVGEEYLSDFQDVSEVRVFTDYREMIASASVDAVNDFTTHGMHHLVGAEAIRHGKHLLSQKPLAVTIKASRRLVEQAAKAGITFGVFENARQRLLARQWRWAFAKGPLGVPKMALLGNVGTWWAPDRIVAETPWRHRMAEGGGISLDLGVHQFDMVRQVCGEVRSVTARTAVTEPTRFTRDAAGAVIDQIACDADDTFYASFETEGGCTGTLFGSWSGAGTNTVLGNGPTFYGDGGRVSGDQIHLRDRSEGGALGELYEREADAETKERDRPLGLTNEFAIAQLDWLRAIEAGCQPETSGEEGLIDLACAYAIVESARAGREVLVDDVLNERIDAYQRPINEYFGID